MANINNHNLNIHARKKNEGKSEELYNPSKYQFCNKYNY